MRRIKCPACEAFRVFELMPWLPHKPTPDCTTYEEVEDPPPSLNDRMPKTLLRAFRAR